MGSMEFIILMAGCVIVFILFIVVALLFAKISIMQKKLAILSQGADGQDILEKIEMFFGYIKEVQENYDSILELLKLHDIGIKRSYSKMHLHKYNPFEELGGNLSWILTVVDMNNNGFLINTIYHPDGTQTYCREIKDGKTDAKLTVDEMSCVSVAINK